MKLWIALRTTKDGCCSISDDLYCSSKFGTISCQKYVSKGLLRWSSAQIKDDQRLAVFQSVCLSVCPSVRHTSVFRTFLCRLLKYWLESWYVISPLPACRGTLSLLAVYQSVCLSVCQSVCPQVRHTFVFRIFLCRLLRYWLESWYVNLSWHNTDRVEFCHSWPTFTGVIALCWNFVFRTFFCRRLRYWLAIQYMNLSKHSTAQVPILSRLTYFYRSHCPLLKFSFPDFSLASFEILTWDLVYEFVVT